jgi:hypothetical protein
MSARMLGFCTTLVETTPQVQRATLFILQAVTGLVGAVQDFARLAIVAAVAGHFALPTTVKAARIAVIFRVAACFYLPANLLFTFLTPVACAYPSLRFVKLSGKPVALSSPKGPALVAATLGLAVLLQWGASTLDPPESLAARVKTATEAGALGRLDKVYGTLKDDEALREKARRDCEAGDLAVCTAHGRYLAARDLPRGIVVLRSACEKGNMSACELGYSLNDDVSWYRHQCRLGKNPACAYVAAALAKEGKAAEADAIFKQACFEQRPSLACPEAVTTGYTEAERGELQAAYALRQRTGLVVSTLRHEAMKARAATGSWPDSLPEKPDAWGQPLKATIFPQSLTFTSAGPDRTFDTADDLFFWPDWREVSRDYLVTPK